MKKNTDEIPFNQKISNKILGLRNIFKKVKFTEEEGVFKGTMGDKVWYIPSKDRGQFIWALDFMSTHERHLDELREGDNVIEVGAASGEYTIPAAMKIGNKGRLHAFEVEPATYLCLEKNLAYHNITNVTPVKMAISDESNKSLWLSFDKGSLSGGTFHGEFSDSIHVKTISCDDYVSSNDIDIVDVLKITVNGHEPEVVMGAKNLLKNVRIVTFQTARYQETIKLLSEQGFSVKKSANAALNGVKIILMEKD